MLVLLLSGLSLANPSTLQHSGRLLTADGEPLNGSYAVTFSLDGAGSWSETDTVTVEDGYFSTVLGDQAPLPPEAMLGTRNLAISVGGQALGAQELHAVPSALSVTGAVRVTEDPGACTPATAGALRVDRARVELCDGIAWTWAGQDNALSLVGPGWSDAPDLVYTRLPSGRMGQAHRAVSNGTNDCYQWAHSVLYDYDPSKAYEFSIWIKSNDATQDTYLGFTFGVNGTTVFDAPWANPYFVANYTSSANTWARVNGFLLPSTAPSSGNGRSSVDYTSSTGTDWVGRSSANQVLIRFGGCYSTNSGGQAWFADPMIREVDYNTIQ